MSRRDKNQRYHASASEVQDGSTTVRIYAFCNYRDGYRVETAPQSPFLVLRAKPAKPGDAHPALQWQPFANAVYQGNPGTEAVFMLDASQMGEGIETQELSGGPTVLGALTKPITKTIVRLNTRQAVLVGAGPTAWHIVRMLAVGFTGADELVDGALLLLPGAPPAHVEQTLRRAKPMNAVAGHQWRPKLCVLTSDATMGGLRPLLDERFDIVCAEQVPGEHMFVTSTRLAFAEFGIARGDSAGDAAPSSGAIGTTVHATSGSRETTITTYHVAIVRSPYSKQLEQHAERADLAPVKASQAAGAARPAQGDSSDDEAESEPEDDDDEDVTNVAAAGPGRRAAGATSAALVFPSDYANVVGSTVEAHGVVVDERTVVNAHGSVSVAPDAVEAAGLRGYVGRAVKFTATIGAVDGHVCFASVTAIEALPAPKTKYGRLLCSPAQAPAINHSAMQHCYGCIVLRGRKCALVRSVENAYDGLRFPYAPLEAPFTPLEAAIRATCKQLDVSPDNFCVRQELPTVTFYPANAHVTVTLFIASATFSPPGGAARDEIEEDMVDDDPYDWLTAAQANEELRSAPERAALEDVVRTVRRATDAGRLLPAIPGLGTFGDAGVRPSTVVAFVHAPAAASIAETLEAARAIAAGHPDPARVAVLEPADGKCPSRRRKAAVKAISELLGGRKDATVLVPVAPAADLDLVQFELAPAVTEKLWAATRLVTVFHADRVPLEPCSSTPLPGAVTGATIVSHALASLEQCDVAVLVCESQPGAWDHASFSACVQGFNRSAALSDGLAYAGHLLKASGDVRPLSNFAETNPAASRVAVLQFDRTSPSALPLNTAAVEERLLAQPAAREELTRLGVVYLCGHVWLSTRPDHQAEISMVAGRVALVKGPRWSVAPGFALRVVITGRDVPELRERAAATEALLAALGVKNREQMQAVGDGLGWVDGSDDEAD